MEPALAICERTPLVTVTPNGEAQLIEELREAPQELRVNRRLLGSTDTLRTLLRTHITNSQWLLLALDMTQSTRKVTDTKKWGGVYPQVLDRKPCWANQSPAASHQSRITSHSPPVLSSNQRHKTDH